MGGKTGTSQVRRITLQEREMGLKKNEERPWRERDHALFVGYAPISSLAMLALLSLSMVAAVQNPAAPIASATFCVRLSD